MIALATLFLSGCNNSKTPEKVLNNFTEMFPDAREAQWEMEDEMWDVAFTWKGKQYEASFREDGSWYETEYEIEPSSLPDLAKEFLSNDYAGSDIEEVEFVERNDFRGYEVEFEADGKETELYFNEAGELIAIEIEEVEK
jgi:uncharacterized membrane protein YkoI